MRPILLILTLLPGCRAETPLPEAIEDWIPGIERTDLAVDLAELTAHAALTVDSAGRGAVSLDVTGLDVAGVTVDGESAAWRVVNGRLDVGLRPADTSLVEVEYAFGVADRFEGLMDTGTTLTWPTWCGNLFPCRPEPAQGSRLLLDVIGAEGEIVFAPDSVGRAPAYQLAWATGAYTSLPLGTSAGGTELVAWVLPGGGDAAMAGAADLPAVFGWLEATLGPYPFGSVAGAVQVEWGPGAFGGMEHHPLWHVATEAMADPVTQAHEAAHGWFGGGVRIACWEDLVLSEGTVTYLAARALGAVRGPEHEAAIWAEYGAELNAILNGPLNRDYAVLPDSCGEVDVLDGLFGRALYLKGAWFFRDTSEAIGPEALDRALRAVFTGFGGRAARMTDVLAAIEAESGWDPEPLAEVWLRTEGGPDGWAPPDAVASP